MCRFVLYLGCEIGIDSLMTEPENSIIHQSFKSREREEPEDGDVTVNLPHSGYST